MTESNRLNLVGIAGFVILIAALAVPFVLYPRFWTSRTLGDGAPWYFMGRNVLEGVSAAVGLLLTALLGVVANRRVGPGAWSALTPTLLFLAFPFGQGVNVLLHSRRIWAGLPAASTEWKSFDEYLYSNTVAGFVAIAIMFAVTWILRDHPTSGRRTSG